MIRRTHIGPPRCSPLHLELGTQRSFGEGTGNPKLPWFIGRSRDLSVHNSCLYITLRLRVTCFACWFHAPSFLLDAAVVLGAFLVHL